MLQKLFIQNYAIIEELEIQFFGHLNIITGETGAGKSILMGALSLIFGERAESSLLCNPDKKCIVEGSFSATDQLEIKAFLKSHDLDNDLELVIRREIAPNGKSRAFINDTPVNLSQLKSLSDLLVDLHQQFDTLELNRSDFQQEVLDALADNGSLLQEYRASFQQYISTDKETELLKTQQARANAELDYNRFQLEELDTLDLKENELEDLDAELKLLGNAESVKQQLGQVIIELDESEQPVVAHLKSLVNKLHALEQYHTQIPVMATRLLATQVELQDITRELQHIHQGIHYSEERIQIVNDRLSVGYRLLKKHGVQTSSELLQIRDELQQKMNEVLNINDRIQQMEAKTTALKKQSETLAASISAKRKKAIPGFVKQVDALLLQVGMPNARFKVALDAAVSLHMNGADHIEFLFDANKTDRFEALRKVASGGELSRLMLCIKSLVARQLQLPTLIFDEIDTGISGEAARQVGNIMKSLSANHQLIAITHQAQIAARADAHFFVYKTIVKDTIQTSVRLLNAEERITHIAQMLSGEKPTAAALQNAREMLGN